MMGLVPGTKKGSSVDLAGLRVLVVGLGVTGASVARFLASRGARVTATDRKGEAEIASARELKELGVEVRAGSDPEGATGADLVVVSPGVPKDADVVKEAARAGVEVMSELELAWSFIDCPVVAVAGTNGKTTTTSLIGEIMRESGREVFVGGNIGTPLTDYVAEGGGADVCVIEVSSFQLEASSRFTPHVGVLLNITEDHLDRYTGFTDYAETKLKLFANQGTGDYAVVNSADPVISERMRLGAFSGTVVPFSSTEELKAGTFLRDGDMVFRMPNGSEEHYPLDLLTLRGLHNTENAMAAVAAARLAGAKPLHAAQALEKFRAPEHRMEPVRELEGVLYVNDSKGTNVGSLAAALRGMETPVVLIAGGRDKGGDYSALTGLIGDRVRLLVLMGEAAGRMEAELGDLARTVRAESLGQAVAIAHAGAKEGDTVLLCPACSSFDMFADYKDRGEKFREFVEAL